MKKYYLSIDQSTQGTKAFLFDSGASLVASASRAHRQIVNEAGWVEHDPEEIYTNVILVVKDVLKKEAENRGLSQADIASEVAGCGISNQRETSVAVDAGTGKPVMNAIVWQCPRAAGIAAALEAAGVGQTVKEKSGIPLSPYFPGAKFAWILQNVPEADVLMKKGALRFGTMDTYVLYRLTGGANGGVWKTDCSNASRTQLFNLSSLSWDEELLSVFGIDRSALAEVCASDSLFGVSDFEGTFPDPIPIHAMLGDSHAALFAEGCFTPGMTKATYGTGSSVMMNIGEKLPERPSEGVVTSIGFKAGGKLCYVLEGNINYSAAVVSWLKDDLGLIQSPAETADLAAAANPADETILIPAFTGLGAPYWKPEARARLVNMSRTTTKKEIVRAALDGIAFQIADTVKEMDKAMPGIVKSLKADGGASKNPWLMQRQADLLGIPVETSSLNELSGAGAAYAAGLADGFFTESELFSDETRSIYRPSMSEAERARWQGLWEKALKEQI